MNRILPIIGLVVVLVLAFSIPCASGIAAAQPGSGATPPPELANSTRSLNEINTPLGSTLHQQSPSQSP